MAMISAERTKSVRMAPLILSFSSATRSTARRPARWRARRRGRRLPRGCAGSGGRASRSLRSRGRRRRPSAAASPAHGAKALIASADGTRIALLISEPLATAHTTGSSRSAATPETCCALSARSSPRTPAVFLAATLVITDTSSRMVATSSSRASRLVAIGLVQRMDESDWKGGRAARGYFFFAAGLAFAAGFFAPDDAAARRDSPRSRTRSCRGRRRAGSRAWRRARTRRR